jgi:hypothetical protein
VISVAAPPATPSTTLCSVPVTTRLVFRSIDETTFLPCSTQSIATFRRPRSEATLSRLTLIGHSFGAYGILAAAGAASCAVVPRAIIGLQP